MDWPEHLLPLPSESYGAMSNPALSKTEFEIGFRQRRKYTGIEERVNLVWILTQEELDTMEAFIQRNMEHGSMPVQMTIIGLNGLRRETVSIAGGSINKSYLPGSNYQVSCSLFVEPKAIADEDLMDWLLYFEDGTPDGFIELTYILDLYLRYHYGVSSESPEIMSFLAAHP